MKIDDLLAPETEETVLAVIVDGEEEEYYDLLYPIESAISAYYRSAPKLRDIDVIRALRNLTHGPAREFNFGSLEHAIQARLFDALRTSKRSKHELIVCLRYILASVRRHRSIDGSRGYLDFITHWV